MSGLGWGEVQLEETAWGWWPSLRDRQTEDSNLWTHSHGNRTEERLDRAQMCTWVKAQEAQSPSKERGASQTHLLQQEPQQGEFHPAKKQAEGRTEKANPGKAHWAAHG